jgi:hypothetical protein
METDPESFDLGIPDSLCRSWWLVMDIPFRSMTREQFWAEQAEMGPVAFERLRCFLRQEQRIIAKLNRKDVSEEDAKHLHSALESIRHCISMERDTIATWGLTDPDPNLTNDSCIGIIFL